MVDLDGRIVSTVTLLHSTFGTVVIGKARAASALSFTLWHQATIEIMRRNLSYYCLFAPRIYMLFFAHIPFVLNHTFNTTLLERL